MSKIYLFPQWLKFCSQNMSKVTIMCLITTSLSSKGFSKKKKKKNQQLYLFVKYFIFPFWTGSANNKACACFKFLTKKLRQNNKFALLPY